MKRIISIAVSLLLIICLCGCESAEEKFPTPTEKFFVNDFAEVMDDTAENEFYTKAATLQKATGAQVVIVTVEDLNGLEPWEYATELGREWGVGSEENNNGIVVLLSRDDREIFISVGYGLEGALPDSKTGRIIDVYGIPYLKNDDFGAGLVAIGNALVNEVYLEYGLTPEAGYTGIENVTVQEDVDGVSVGVSWVIMLVILILIAVLSRRFGGGIFFFDFGGFSGSSGRSSGGDFGGFSGGGGSFGGGGAGRSF